MKLNFIGSKHTLNVKQGSKVVLRDVKMYSFWHLYPYFSLFSSLSTHTSQSMRDSRWQRISNMTALLLIWNVTLDAHSCITGIKNGPSRTEPPWGLHSSSLGIMNQRSVFADPSAMVVLDRSTEQPRRQMKVSTRLIVALMTKFNVWSGGSRNILIEEGFRNIPHVSECRFVWEPRGFRYNGGRFRDMPAPLSSSPATAASAEEEDCHPCSRRPEKSTFGIFISPYRQIHGYFMYCKNISKVNVWLFWTKL